MKWLERDLVIGPHLGLATCERDLHQALRHLKVRRERWPLVWLDADSFGCMRTFTNAAGGVVCIVCIRPEAHRSGIEVASTLIHEAVHVFQEWCDYKCEREPSREFEAYAIESIAGKLMQAYLEQVIA